MDAVHIHLFLNHFPIIGMMIGTGMLITGHISHNGSVKTTAYIIIILMALSAIPVFFSGEGAEEVMEHRPDIPEYLIERHEDVAKAAMWLILPAGIAALAGLLIRLLKRSDFRVVEQLIAIVALVACTMMVYVGYTGGQIHHSEIRKPKETTNVRQQEHRDSTPEHQRDHYDWHRTARVDDRPHIRWMKHPGAMGCMLALWYFGRHNQLQTDLSRCLQS